MLSNGSSGRGYRAQCNHLRRNSWLDCEFLRTRVYTPTSGLNFGQVYRPPNRNWARVNSEMSSQNIQPVASAGFGWWRRHIAPKIAAIPASASILPRSWHWARAAPPTVAARTRIVSAAAIRPDHGKSVRPFKGIFCHDISEFESYMPSQPVQSLWVRSSSQKFVRHSRGLAIAG